MPNRKAGGAAKPLPPKDDAEQSRRFEETARELGVDESGKTFARAIKQIVKRTEDLPRREARATRLPALVEVLTSEDVTEGTNAFKEKRTPEGKGR